MYMLRQRKSGVFVHYSAQLQSESPITALTIIYVVISYKRLLILRHPEWCIAASSIYKTTFSISRMLEGNF